MEAGSSGWPCMAQRILEPGEIETLASRDVPRIILPDTASLFTERAARLRSLAARSAIGGYLQLLAALADAQQAVLEALAPQQREELQAQARAAIERGGRCRHAVAASQHAPA
ncbi:formate dehydrogenase accessory protein FdhE [compost metagenome]